MKRGGLVALSFFSDSPRREPSVGERDLLYTHTPTHARNTPRHSSLRTEARCGCRGGQVSTGPGASWYDEFAGGLCVCVCVFRGRAASPIGRHGRLSMCDGEPADRISGSLELEYINLFLFTLGACVVISKFFLLGVISCHGSILDVGGSRPRYLVMCGGECIVAWAACPTPAAAAPADAVVSACLPARWSISTWPRLTVVNSRRARARASSICL